jgi:hypothetical protein
MRTHLAVLGGFVLAAVVYTWPLVLHLGDRVVDGIDVGFMIWNLWDAANRLAGGTLFHTTMLYYPSGADLYLHTWFPALSLPLAPLTWVLGPVVAYNVALLLGFVFTGYTMYLLCRDLGASHWAAVFGGAALDFCAWHLVRLHGHLNQASIYWIPLYLLCLFRLARPAAQQGRGRVVWPLLIALTLALCALIDFQQVVYVALPTGLWLLTRLLDRQQPRRLLLLAQTAAAWVLAGLALAPILAGLVRQQASGDYVRPEFAQVVTFSADLLAFVVPFQYNTLIGPAVTPIVNGLWGKLDTERAEYLTLTLLVLGLWGVGITGRVGRYWLNLALLAFVLALGPALHVGGATSVPLPYLALYLLPGGDSIRAPARLGLWVVFALAVLAALALTRWEAAGLGVSASDPARWRARWMLGGAFVALLLETMAFPHPTVDLPVSGFYRQIATDAAPKKAIVDVPMRDESIYEYYQTVHGHPMVGGYLSRDRIDPLIEGGPLLRDLKYLDAGDIVAQDAVAAGQALAARNGFGYIVVHKHPPLADAGFGPWAPADAARARDWATRAGRQIYDDDTLTAYALDPPPAGRPPALLLGAGWESVSDDKTRGRGRWAGPGADLIVDAPAPLTVTLQLTAEGYPAARPLRLLRDGTVLLTCAATQQPTACTSAPLTVPAGLTHLRLDSDGPPGLLPGLPLDRYHTPALAYVTRLALSTTP